MTTYLDHLKYRENGGRRYMPNRRHYLYTSHIPERRNYIDRRNGIDRRKMPLKNSRLLSQKYQLSV